MIFFLTFFSSMSVTFLITEKWMNARKIIKGLIFGVSWGAVYFLGAIETYPVFGKTSLIADMRLASVDSLSIIVLGILFGIFFASDGRSSKANMKNNSFTLVVVTAFYIIGRYFAYSVLGIESGFIERPVSTFIWTLATGISFGTLYMLAGRNIREKNLMKRSVFFGLTNVGPNWLIFNLFWPFVFQSSFADAIVGRTIVDTFFIVLGAYFSERLINRKATNLSS